MATGITVTLKADTQDFERKVRSAMDTGSQNVRQFNSAINQSSANLAAMRRNIDNLRSALTTLAGVAIFKQIAQFGIDLDKSRNAMIALTGSVERANAKMLELRNLARSSPGVTTSFATDLFRQLSAVSGVADKTINETIKSLGKLNSVFGDIGPDFSRNLVQIFQQGFERGDIKEALGRLPIFEQLLKTAFGTDDGAKLRKLKDAGKLTLGGFLDGFSGAIESDPRLKNAADSLGDKLTKSLEDVKQRLAELGERTLRDVLPTFERLLDVAGSLLSTFNKLPDSVKTATIGLALISPAISPVVTAVRTLTTAFLALGGAMQASLGLVGGVLIGGTVAYLGYQEMIERQRGDIDRQLGPRKNIDGTLINPGGTKELFGLVSPNALNSKLKIGNGQLMFNEATGTFAASAATNNTNLSNLGATAGAVRANEEAQKTAQKVAEIQKDILESQKERGDRLIDQMNSLYAEVLSNSRELAGEPAAREARRAQVAGFSVANAERLRQIDLRSIELSENTNKAAIDKQREALDKLKPTLSTTERFMQGLRGETDALGIAFERFGDSVGNAFGDVRNLFTGLRQAIRSFFQDITANVLRNVTASVLGPLLGRSPNFAMAGGGSVFTGGFAGGGGAGDILRSATGYGGGGYGGGYGGGGAAPTGGVLGSVRNFFSGGAGQVIGAGIAGGSIGAALGGSSVGGNILGAIGGGVASIATGALASGGLQIGSLALSGLAATGIGAAIAAPLLIGSVLFGKASQRRRDEQASGEYLTQAARAIEQLAAGISSGSIDGSQARGIFDSQILGTFRQQISGLKTRSVVESRLTNQVRDLQKMYSDLVEPAIATQIQSRRDAATNALAFSRQIPEFASGGIVPGIDRGRDSVMAMLRPGELVLNRSQQQRVIAQAGPGVFSRAGVPAINTTGRYDVGGYAQQSGGADQPINITLDAQVVISEKTATGIYIVGGSTERGRRVTVNNVKVAQLNREL